MVFFLDLRNINVFLFFSGISSLCFTNYGEALYMMSSSELQRISLAANKVVSLEGTIDLQPLTEEDDRIDRHDDDDEDDDDDDDDDESDRKSDINMTSLTISSVTGGAVGGASSSGAAAAVKLNGHHSPVNDAANTTTTSSVGDLTLDSIRDHLNSSTITTLHKQTTEEVVGKLLVVPLMAICLVEAETKMRFPPSKFNLFCLRFTAVCVCVVRMSLIFI